MDNRFQKWRCTESPSHIHTAEVGGREGDTQFKDKPLVVANSKDESTAKKLLTGRLRDTPDLKRSDAQSFLREAGSMITGRAFSRVWREARVAAQLPATAPGGRKSSH